MPPSPKEVHARYEVAWQDTLRRKATMTGDYPQQQPPKSFGNPSQRPSNSLSPSEPFEKPFNNRSIPRKPSETQRLPSAPHPIKLLRPARTPGNLSNQRQLSTPPSWTRTARTGPGSGPAVKAGKGYEQEVSITIYYLLSPF